MSKSVQTRQRILDVAIRLFRKRGFDGTTMRQIAQAAKTSLGSAYYYFPQKEAIVLAYFAEQMVRHEERAEQVYASTLDPRERVLGAFVTRLDLMQDDQKFFGGLLRTIGDPEGSVSVFSEENAPLRARGMAILRRALEVPEVPESVRDDAALMLWGLVLTMVLLFVHDRSAGQVRTRRFVEGAVDLVVPLLPLLCLPEAELLRARVRTLLAESGVLDEVTAAVGPT